MTSHKVVGRRLPRVDAIEKATGESRYVDDCFVEGALYVRTFGSPRAHLRIQRLDLSHALQVPGVIRIITAHDIPGKNKLPWWDQPFLVEQEARFFGEPIALVVADTPEAACLGVEKIRIDIEELPFVSDAESALSPDAPAVTVTRHGRNVWDRWVREQGDVEAAFSQSDLLIQKEYTTPFHAAGHLEPAGVIAEPDPDGGVVVYGSLQSPFAVQEALAELLELPHNRVRVVQRPLGGSGGGKAEGASLLAGHAALVAWLVGKPARLIYQSDEDFAFTGKRHPTKVTIKYGAQRNGTLLGCAISLDLQAGAYPSTSPETLLRAVAHAIGPYDIPHVKVEARTIATHNVPSSALWGYGQLPLCFAQECLLDELAKRLSMDPIALRRKNMLSHGKTMLWGAPVSEMCGLPQVLDSILEHVNWDEKRRNYKAQPEEGTPSNGGCVKRGIGIGLAYTGIGAGAESRLTEQATASVQLLQDGTVLVATAHAETGHGSRTLIAQMVAESLSAPYEVIRVLESDTTRVPGFGRRLHGHSLLANGHALLKATQPLREQLLLVASQQFECLPEEVVMKPGRFISPDGKQLSFAQVVSAGWTIGMPMAQYGWGALPRPPHFLQELGNPQETAPPPLTQPLYPTYVYSAQIAEVEVDIETFHVRVISVHSAHDSGRSINPLLTESAIESGALQGIGYALIEKIEVRDGQLHNGRLAKYPIPTFQELPTVHPLLLQNPEPNQPFGYKSLGESPVLAVVPAVVNAICNALECSIEQLPVTPELLYTLISPDTRYGD